MQSILWRWMPAIMVSELLARWFMSAWTLKHPKAKENLRRMVSDFVGLTSNVLVACFWCISLIFTDGVMYFLKTFLFVAALSMTVHLIIVRRRNAKANKHA